MSSINSNNTTEIKVQVALRIRPLSAEELVNIPSRLQRNAITTTPFTPNQVVVQSEKKKSFTFDHVFGPESTQKEIYDKTVTNLIDQFLEGNNVTVLAFGHTYSGKTYTIGTDNSSLTQESKGIISRTMTTLLSYINSTQYKSRKFFMKISFVEIYNDELIDLLREGSDKKANTVLTGLQEIRVNSAEEAMGILSLGQLNRRTNAQDLNQNDPDNNNNSHVIVTVTLSQQKFIPTNGPSTNSTSNTPPTTPNKTFSPKLNKQFEGDWVTVTSKFHFVDLAGNEMEKGNFGLEYKLKERFTPTDETPTKVAIGNVICALGELGDPLQNATFSPYKDDKLTKILKNYLCNNYRTLIIACASPIEYNIKETTNTLEYAKRIRNIKYSSHKIIYQDQEEEEEEGWNNLEHLQNLVLKLRSEIKALKNTLTISVPFDNDLDSGSISSSSSSAHDADISRQSSLSRPNSEKEINLLEDKFIILKRSFNDLSKEFSKSEVSTIIPEENVEKLIIDHDTSYSEEDTDNTTLVQDDNSSSSSSNNESRLKRTDKKHFIQNVWPSFQKAVGPVIQEYEKSISSLENQLSLVRAALSHSESKMQTQEYKLIEAEECSEKNKNMINDLKYEISKLYERGETTENYIKDLEAKLNSDTYERKKDQVIINDLKNRLEKLSSNEESTESTIRELESRLEENEIKNSKMNEIDLQLEKDLHYKENKYLALIEQFENQKNDDKEEKKLLLAEIKTRDDKILQLEKNVENLINEIEKMKQLRIEVTSHPRNKHSKSSSTSSINIEHNPRPSIQISEFPSVSTLEFQFDNLQITHKKTLEELNDIQNKYQTCLSELKELRSQRIIVNSINEELVNNSDSLSTFKPPFKAKSLSNLRGERIESEQLETVHLDVIKQEFANLQINYYKTLEIVEKLRQEIKRRDTLTQLEVTSEKDFEIGETASDCLEQTSDENLKELEDKVKDLEDQLIDTEVVQQDTITQVPLLGLSQKYIKEFQEKLDLLQRELTHKSETIENLQVGQGIIMVLQEQLKNLEAEIKNKHDLIESVKKDLTNNVMLEKKLRQKEAQTLNLNVNLLRVQKQEEALQKEIDELRKCLENGDVDQVRQSELDRLRKELKNAHEREIIALERLRILKERLGNDSEESQLQEQLDYLQYIEIIQKNRITDLENRISEKGIRGVDEYLIQLKTDLAIAKESKLSYVKTIEALEIKLKNVEHKSQLLTLEQQIQDLKLKESEQLQNIHSLEIKLNDQSIGDFNRIKQLLEETKKILEHEQKQEHRLTEITNSLKEFEEVSGFNSIRNELNELNYSKSDLCKKVQELQTKLVISEEQLLIFESLQEEILYLKSLDSEQKITIQQLHLQLNQTRDSKESTVKELMTLKESFSLQKEIVKSLEIETKTLKEELTITQENHISLTQEFEKMSSLLDTTQKQCANEKKQVEALEIEVEAFRLTENSGDESVNSLRDALKNTKLEMVAQNEIINELESEVIAIEKERDYHIKLSNQLTSAVEENESNHKGIVKELKSEKLILEEQLTLAQESSKLNKEIITNLKEELFNVQTQLDNAKNSDNEQIKIIKEMETRLSETNHSLTRREDKFMTQQKQSMIETYNTAELTTELEKARAAESARIILIKELETKLKEKNNDINELQEAVEFSNAELMKLQESENKHTELINRLERELRDIKKQQGKEIPDVNKGIKTLEGSQKFTNVFSEDQYSGIKKFTIDKFTDSNELLQENNDSLIAEIIELETRATILTNQNENLQDEITKRNSYDTDSLMEMKTKVKELQTVKNELENVNETFFERCSKLEEKVQSLMKQLWTLGNDGNAMALQVADLNNQIMNREKEIATLKQKSSVGHKESESEISRLLNENKLLKEKVKDLSVQASKGINTALIQGLSEKSNYNSSSDKDEILVSKLLQHENTITQQNDLIKTLQEQISELERLFDESYSNTNAKTENYAELLAEIQKLNKKIEKSESENLKNKQLVETLEITFDENEEQLQRTKEELNSVLSQKQDLLKYINELKTVLDISKNEIETTKTAVETQKVHMEKALDEERKAKEKSEIARIALENRLEQLMAKKNKFMCF